MKTISKKRIKELGFTPNYSDTFVNGDVFIILSKNTFKVFVSARMTSGEDYARPAIGVKTENDLIELCRLINGID